MRHYETIFLLKPTLTEEEIKQKIEFFRNLVTENGGTIAGFDDIGMRQLAYEIEHNKRGYYYVIYFTSENYGIVDAIQRIYRITEDVLKFMTIKFEKQVELKAWNNMVNNVALPELKKPEYKKDNNRDDRGSRGRRDYKNRDNRSNDSRSNDSRPNTSAEQKETPKKEEA
jgi:small subunit ribosomal protein S6